MRVLLVLLASFALGCVHTYEMHSMVGDAPSAKLSRQASFYVAIPQDGRFGTRVYASSGTMTAQAIVAAFSAHALRVRSANSVAPLEDNIAAARSESVSYLVQPTILHWEERATEWSGKPDRISVRIDLVDAATGQTLDSTVISGKSRWATFGGDHPQELLPEPLHQYVDDLFVP